jgi:hypothetical protein
MHSSPLPCYHVLLRPKYLPQHHIVDHPQPMLLPQCERPSFTRIQNNRQNYISGWMHTPIWRSCVGINIKRPTEMREFLNIDSR